jgi:hypothetical protein
MTGHSAHIISGVDLTYPAIRYGLTECLQRAHLERRRGHRVVTDLVRMRRYNQGTDANELASL